MIVKTSYHMSLELYQLSMCLILPRGKYKIITPYASLKIKQVYIRSCYFMLVLD